MEKTLKYTIYQKLTHICPGSIRGKRTSTYNDDEANAWSTQKSVSIRVQSYPRQSEKPPQCEFLCIRAFHR